MHGFNRELTIEDIDLGGPRTGEVLVNLKASGVCHSDWHALKGDWGKYSLPLVLGHEGAGVVQEVGANVAVDLRDNKLELGRRFGATHTVNAANDDPVDAILSLTGGAGVHYAFEAIGVASAPYLQSVRCTRRRGVTVWVGHAPLNTPVQFDARDLFFERTVIGSFYGSARTHVDFLRILSLYRDGKLLLDELVSKRLPLDQVNTAFESLAQGDVARSVLIME